MERVWLKNDKGMKVSLITLGATVTHLLVPLPDGETVDVILGFEKLEDFSDNSPYFGCIVGFLSFLSYAHKLALLLTNE